ncbi:MAG: vWA domain-containing protein, partial [Gemmatimonadales bacterium]
MTELTFDSTLLLILAPLTGVVAALLALWLRRRRIGRALAWSPAVAERAARYGRTAPFVLGLAALGAMVALAGPRGGRTMVTTESRALSLVIAMDISRSMLAEDVEPSRLERAKREARRLVQDSEGDRIGLLAFAGRSYILSPLTVDAGAILLYLDALDPDLASQGGTSLEAVLTQGRELLEASSDPADRVLVIFTDGESHDSLSGAIEQADALKEAGVRVILVAEGSGEAVRIPIRDSLGTL